ncbi:MAG: hypothetical protein NTW49_09870 [Bacteroidia bacterium]|nr:hypothetical protein [Bacteroidia bacterium]
MKTKLLFPRSIKKYGWILCGIAILLVLWVSIFGEIAFLKHVPVFYIYDSGIPFENAHRPFFGIKYDDIQFELFMTFFVAGCLFIGFSRLKSEDEFTLRLRLESLLWAVYITFSIFILTVLFVYGVFFIYIALFSLIAFMVIFIIRFFYVLYKSKKSLNNE